VQLIRSEPLMFTSQMLACGPGQKFNRGWKELGTDCTYCTGEFAQGSSTKTPYMVCPFPQPPYFAHMMQHPDTDQVVREEGRKNRGSELSVAQQGSEGNRIRLR
jgi:hypothetical protein